CCGNAPTTALALPHGPRSSAVYTGLSGSWGLSGRQQRCAAQPSSPCH
ncbi:MAG: hypothetical protein AVDCRST_MAG19-4539, partial [uncultured Thermomicrobiales bacterium]